MKLLCYVNLSFFYSPSEVEKKTALVAHHDSSAWTSSVHQCSKHNKIFHWSYFFSIMFQLMCYCQKELSDTYNVHSFVN